MAASVDARGLSCPQPMFLTRQALVEAGTGEVVVLVDAADQVENCTRTAERMGWQATCEKKAGGFELTFRRSQPRT